MSSKLYKKKPVVVSAIQLTRQSVLEVYELVHGEPVDLSSSIASSKFHDYYVDIVAEKGMRIPTLEDGKAGNEAEHIASLGDYIIKGVKGEFYPCKPDIFEMTYEEVK